MGRGEHPILDFHLFGGARVLRDGQPIPLGSKQQQLLAVLMLFAGRRVSSDLLVDHLWGDRLPANPLNSLQDVVRRLRSVLGDTGHRVVVTEGREYCLVVHPDHLDVGIFGRLARAGLALAIDANETSKSSIFLAKALEISDGDLPDVRPGSRMDVPLDRIHLLRRTVIDVLEGGDSRVPSTDQPSHLAQAPAGLAIEMPEVEDLVLADCIGDMLRFHGRLRRFEQGLMVVSFPGIAGAVRSAFAVSDRLPADQPLLKGAICRLERLDEPWRDENLLRLLALAEPGRILVGLDARDRPTPASVTELLRPYSGSSWQISPVQEILEIAGRRFLENVPIVGRQRLIVHVMALLGDHRLITLRGPGGIGKTRVAQEVARRVTERFRDGVCFVDLAEADDHGGPLPLIMRTLGYPPQPYRHLEDSLVDVLRDSEQLLILDNCEGFEEEMRALCEALREICPSVRLLVTSRSALAATDELICEVGELDVSDAARLLMALAYREGVTSPEEPLDSTVLGLCSQLDNVPLAIECVASMVRTMGLAAASAALRSVPDGAVVPLLDAAYRGRGRHRSIELALNASCSTLEPADVTLFECLSSLRGRFRTEDAIGVCPGVDGRAVAAGLERLWAASLVKRVGEGRWRLLEPVRQFGATRLMRKGEHFCQSTRHANHFISLAARAENELTGVNAELWFGRLTEAYPNLDRALSWAVEAGDAIGALRLTSSLWWYWAAKGMFVEGARAVERALALEGSVPEELRVKTLVAVSYLSWWAGNPRRTESSLHEAMEIITGAGSKSSFGRLKAWAHTGLAAARFWGGGDYSSLDRHLEQGRELFARAGDLPGLGLNLSTHSGVAWHYGQDLLHHSKAVESLRVFQEAEHQTMVAHMKRVVGLATANLGEVKSGRALLLEGLELSERIEDAGGLPLGYAFLGLLETWAQNRGTARAAFRESIDANRSLGQIWPTVLALSFAAEEAAYGDRPGDALRLHSAFETVSERTRIGLAPEDRARVGLAVRQAMDRLDPHQIARLKEEGAATPLSASVGLALDVIRDVE